MVTEYCSVRRPCGLEKSGRNRALQITCMFFLFVCFFSQMATPFIFVIMFQILILLLLQVTDNGIISLATGVCKQTLCELNMNHCIHLSDEAVEGVVNFCPRIAILLFHGCPCITGKNTYMERASSAL